MSWLAGWLAGPLFVWQGIRVNVLSCTTHKLAAKARGKESINSYIILLVGGVISKWRSEQASVEEKKLTGWYRSCRWWWWWCWESANIWQQQSYPCLHNDDVDVDDDVILNVGFFAVIYFFGVFGHLFFENMMPKKTSLIVLAVATGLRLDQTASDVGVRQHGLVPGQLDLHQLGLALEVVQLLA